MKIHNGLIAVFFVTSSAHAVTERSVMVQGTCLRRVDPDRGSIVLNSEIKGPDAKRVSADAGRLYEAVKSKINQLRLKDQELKTSEMVVEEIREYEGQKIVSKGFHGRMGLKLTTSEISRLGEATEVATREGVKDIGRMTLEVSPAKMRETRNECLKEAAEQAKIKATRLADSLGAKLGEVLTIQELAAPGPNYPGPMMAEGFSMAAMKSAPSAPSVDVGKEELSVTVSVSFGLR